MYFPADPISRRSRRVFHSTFILFVAVCFSHPMNCSAQDDPGPVMKIGGMYNGRHPTAYSLCFERERVFSRYPSFTRGIRLDYDRTEPSSQPYSPGAMSLVIGYQFKYYPLTPLRKKVSRGFFLGASPCYFIKVRDQYPYGPGVGFLLGWQIWIKNQVTLSLEWNILGWQNFNQNISSGVSNEWYFDVFVFAKAGYRFAKNN
jgi:hypothetical protein